MADVVAAPVAQAPEEAKPARPKRDGLQEKFDAQKKVLQRMVLSALERGRETGMEAHEVAALADALLVLGWLPPDVKV